MSARRGRSAASSAKLRSQTQEQSNLRLTIGGTRRAQPPVASPTTQYIKPVDDATTRAAESERRACPRLQIGFLVDSSTALYERSKIHVFIRTGERGTITTRSPRGGAACGRTPTAPRGRCTPGAGRGSSAAGGRRAGDPTARPAPWPCESPATSYPKSSRRPYGGSPRR